PRSGRPAPHPHLSARRLSERARDRARQGGREEREGGVPVLRSADRSRGLDGVQRDPQSPRMTSPSRPERPIDPGVRIGHVHLKVADLDRSLAFYCGVLGFELTQRLGSGAAFISAGGYHHHIGLNTWESRGGSPPPPGTTGLYHVAILYPTRAALADALRRLMAAGIPLTGASDHGV